MARHTSLCAVSVPRPTPRAALAGPVLVLFGLACWALYVQRSHSEPHAYSRGANPPAYVQLAAGETYQISIHGGVRREAQLGLDPVALQCTAARPGQAPGALRLASVEQTGSKATDQIASFASTISGSVRIQCAGIGAVYVDDAENSPFDWSGVWLVLASLALLVGLPLTLSLLRDTTLRSAEPAVDEYDQVE